MSLAVGGPFDPGDQVVITATLADLDGDPASPSAYTWKVKAPGVTEASYTQASPECDDPGILHPDDRDDEPPRHLVRVDHRDRRPHLRRRRPVHRLQVGDHASLIPRRLPLAGSPPPPLA
jgi:hypothetical protein